MRIDSYESEANQEVVRGYLRGSFANTAFCILAPDGETRLSGSGRSPSQVFRTTEGFVEALEKISKDYPAKGDLDQAPLPEYPRFELALNVASADQRLLVLIAGQGDALSKAEKQLRPLAWDETVQGRFLIDVDSGATWQEPLGLVSDAAEGIYVVQPGTFGLKGEVVAKLALDAPHQTILEALAKANKAHATDSEKKDYAAHVREGRRQGKSIDMAMPFGEDRDGDGEIDDRRSRRK